MKRQSDLEWLVPVMMGLGVIVFFGLIIGLIFFVKPPLRDLSRNQRPIYVFNTDPIQLKIGQMKLEVPQNHVREVKKATNQQIKEITLHALLPDMEGYRKDNWWLFDDGARTARMILIRLSHTQNALDEKMRFRHLYRHQLELAATNDAPLGLEHYLYKDQQKRLHQDVFTGLDRYKRRLIYFCFRPSSISITPHCSRTFPAATDIALTYRFKRIHLSEWQVIDDRIQNFIEQIQQLSLYPKKPILAEQF